MGGVIAADGDQRCDSAGSAAVALKQGATVDDKTKQAAIAAQVLAEQTKEAAPTFPKVGDSYVEPCSVAAFKARLADVGRGMVDPNRIAAEYKKLAEEAVARIDALTNALMPFGTQAMMMANMVMTLEGMGRGGEPGGGTWINGPANAQLQTNQTVFFLAADAIGRKAVEQRVMEVFQKIQESQAAERERDAHVAEPTLEGPIGGPVSGRSH